MVVYGIQLVAIVFLRLRLMRLNVIKRREQGIRESQAAGQEAVRTAFIVVAPHFDRVYYRESRLATGTLLTISLTEKIETVSTRCISRIMVGSNCTVQSVMSIE